MLVEPHHPQPTKWAGNLHVRVNGFQNTWELFHNCQKFPKIRSLFTWFCDLMQLRSVETPSVTVDGKNIGLDDEIYDLRDKVIVLAGSWFTQLTFSFAGDGMNVKLSVPITTCLEQVLKTQLVEMHPGETVKKLCVVRASGGPRVMLSLKKNVKEMLSANKIKTGDTVDVYFEMEAEPVREEAEVAIALEGSDKNIKLKLMPGEVIPKKQLFERMAEKSLICLSYVCMLFKWNETAEEWVVTQKIDGATLKYRVKENRKRLYAEFLFGSETAADTRKRSTVSPGNTFKDLIKDHPDAEGPSCEFCVQVIKRDGTPMPDLLMDLERKVIDYFEKECKRNVRCFVIKQKPERKIIRCKITREGEGDGPRMAFEEFHDDVIISQLAKLLLADRDDFAVDFLVGGELVPAEVMREGTRLGQIHETGKDIEIHIHPKRRRAELAQKFAVFPESLSNYTENKPPYLDPKTVRMYTSNSDPSHSILVKIVDQAQEGCRELELFTKFRHPCILKFLGLVPIRPHVGLVCECHAGLIPLDQLLLRPRQYGVMSDTDKANVITGIAMAMSYLHDNNVIHRNFCPASIMVDEKRRPFITDFAMARVVAENDGMTLTLQIGSPEYAAPEMLKRDGVYTQAVDVWSFGTVVYEIITGQRAFRGQKNFFQVMLRIVEGKMPTFPDDLDDTPIAEVVKRCWSLKPKERPPFKTLLEEFERMDYQFLPGVDVEVVRNFVQRVRAEARTE